MPAKTAAARKTRRVIDKRWEKIEKGFDQFQETLRELAAQHKESEKGTQEFKEANERGIQELREAHQETEKALKETQRIVGSLGNRFGDLAEQMLIPDLVEKFESCGFIFKELGRNIKWKSKEHSFSMEFDALLKNDIQVMVVEVKAKLNRNDVDEQLVRMDKARRYADMSGDKRQYYGAIAAMTAPDRIIEYALAKGFFLIMPSGEDVAITRPAPEPRVWQPAAAAQGTY